MAGGSQSPSPFPGCSANSPDLPGLKRLRFATSHPRDLSDELIGLFGALEPLCEHLHLPVQSGSNRVLAAMNRVYTAEQYLQKVEKLRRRLPGISLSTDLIVGFPGETEADFQETLHLVREARFQQAFCFKYSPRPQTRAATMPDQVEEGVKAERLARLLDLQDQITLAAHQGLVGEIREVLVAGESKRSGQPTLRPPPDQPGGEFFRTAGTCRSTGLRGDNRGPSPLPQGAMGGRALALQTVGGARGIAKEVACLERWWFRG